MNEWPPSLDAPSRVLASRVSVFHAIEFALVAGYRPLQLDLYLPPRSAGTSHSGPAAVYLHGGGWSVGTRRRFGRAFREWAPTPLELLAAAGFAVATVDYRLTGEAIFPAQLHDAKAAVRWVRTNAATLGVDPNRILVWGESAGAHLALLVGLTAMRPDLEGTIGDLDVGSGVCGVVDWYGPTDFANLADDRRGVGEAVDDGPESSEARLLGAPVDEAVQQARIASPMSYVHPGAPPIQIHHGTDDRVIPFRQSERLAAALRECGAHVEFVPVPGSDHYWTGAPDVGAVFTASLEFARRVTG